MSDLFLWLKNFCNISGNVKKIFLPRKFLFYLYKRLKDFLGNQNLPQVIENCHFEPTINKAIILDFSRFWGL